jgi:hypothetical protein
MYGLVSILGPTWSALASWESLAQVLGAVILGLFLVLHVIVVRSVIRPMDGPGRVVATLDRRVRAPANVQPEVTYTDAKDKRSASRASGLSRGTSAVPHLRQHRLIENCISVNEVGP